MSSAKLEVPIQTRIANWVVNKLKSRRGCAILQNNLITKEGDHARYVHGDSGGRMLKRFSVVKTCVGVR